MFIQEECFQAREPRRGELRATAYLLYSGATKGLLRGQVECEEGWAGDQSEAPEKPIDQQEGWGLYSEEALKECERKGSAL